MIGEKLKIAIKAAGIEPTEAANYIGISEGNLYKLFKKDSFEIDYLRKASSLTGQPLSYFLGEDSQILQNPQKGESNSGKLLIEYVREVEEKFERRYEKLIMHYENLLKKYEGQPVNFLNVSELPPVPFIEKKMSVIYKKRNLIIFAQNT